MFNLLGGPSHIDMFDMKPQAPVEIRGEFASDPDIRTRFDNLRASAEALAVDAPRDADSHVQAYVQLTRSAAVHDGFYRWQPGGSGDAHRSAGHWCDLPVSGAGAETICRALCVCHVFPDRVRRGIGDVDPMAASSAGSTTRCSRSANPLLPVSRRLPDYDPVMALGEPVPPTADALADMTVERLDRRRSLISQIDGEIFPGSGISVPSTR